MDQYLLIHDCNTLMWSTFLWIVASNNYHDKCIKILKYTM